MVPPQDEGFTDISIHRANGACGAVRRDGASPCNRGEGCDACRRGCFALKNQLAIFFLNYSFGKLTNDSRSGHCYSVCGGKVGYGRST